MAKIVVDRVLETSTTTGSGAYTLAGAVAGFRPASTVCANGDTFDYYAEDVDANSVPTGGWETGLGTWGTGGILTRTTIYNSSNAGAAVAWTAGTRRIGMGLTASKILSLAAAGANADITSLSGLTTALSIPQGGTGGGTATAACESLGIGTGSFRNRAINGGMQVQNGTVGALSGALTYGTVDMMMCAAVSGTGVSGAIGASPTAGFVSGQACAMAGSWTNAYAFFAHRIESKNSIVLNGKTVTVSGKIFQDTGGPRVFSVGLYKPNSIDNFSALTQVSTTQTTASISTGSVTSFSATFALGATDASIGLQITINDNAQNTVVSKNYFFGDLQIEASSIATPFEKQSYGEDELLCKRYAQRVQWSVRDYNQATGTLLMASQTFSTPMFATPTVTNVASPAVLNMAAPTVTTSALGFRAESTKTATGDTYILDRIDLMTARL